MKKFDIQDNTTQIITHSYVAETMPAYDPNWGTEAEGNVPASFTVFTTDLMAASKADRIANYATLKGRECDEQVNALLAPSEPVTHIMLCLFDMYTILISTTSTDTEKAAAKTNLESYLTLMGQIQAMRAARDADVAAFTAAQG